jgi:hypothetical protein
MLEILDNGGRRIGIERRYYTYTGHIPERRTGADRRTKDDRRNNTQFIDPGNESMFFERRKTLN